MILKVSEIKKLIKDGGKRSSEAFVTAFAEKVERDLQKAINEHNGGKKTLDPALVQYLWPN